MDPDTKQLLEDTFELAKENNKMLHHVRRIQKRQAFWAIVRVILIIGIALGLFYYLEPYLNKIINLASSIPGVKENLNIGSVQEMFKKF